MTKFSYGKLHLRSIHQLRGFWEWNTGSHLSNLFLLYLLLLTLFIIVIVVAGFNTIKRLCKSLQVVSCHKSPTNMAPSYQSYVCIVQLIKANSHILAVNVAQEPNARFWSAIEYITYSCCFKINWMDVAGNCHKRLVCHNARLTIYD